MRLAYRDIMKHSAIYGVGQILSRMASFLLLPLYTSYLRPADYGCIAILDLSATLLGQVIGSGMAWTANRYHFDSEDERDRDQLWWTALTLLISTGAMVLTPMWFLRGQLATLFLGSGQPNGRYFYSLVLPTLCFCTLGEFFFQYLRVRKWSQLTVAMSLGDLLLRIGLNVWFLVGLHTGMVGILWSNLIATGTTTTILFLLFAKSRGHYVVRWAMAGKLWRFGMPLVASALLATVMHQSNRYILSRFSPNDLGPVGIYSLAQSIGQGVFGLIAGTFGAIWTALVYEIASYRDAKRVYIIVFEYYVYTIALVMFGVSLFAKPILSVMAAADYSEAATLVPIVCLAYFLFGLHTHFNVPALLAKKTSLLLPSVSIAAVFNIGANYLLIGWFGVYGAAWACVGTFALFSFVGLAIYRRIDRYEYPLARCTAIIVGMAGCCFVMSLMNRSVKSPLLLIGCAAAIWSTWALALLGRPAARFAYQWWIDRSVGTKEVLTEHATELV